MRRPQKRSPGLRDWRDLLEGVIGRNDEDEKDDSSGSSPGTVENANANPPAARTTPNPVELMADRGAATVPAARGGTVPASFLSTETVAPGGKGASTLLPYPYPAPPSPPTPTPPLFTTTPRPFPSNPPQPQPPAIYPSNTPSISILPNPTFLPPPPPFQPLIPPLPFTPPLLTNTPTTPPLLLLALLPSLIAAILLAALTAYLLHLRRQRRRAKEGIIPPSPPRYTETAEPRTRPDLKPTAVWRKIPAFFSFFPLLRRGGWRARNTPSEMQDADLRDRPSLPNHQAGRPRMPNREEGGAGVRAGLLNDVDNGFYAAGVRDRIEVVGSRERVRVEIRDGWRRSAGTGRGSVPSLGSASWA